MDDGPVHVAIKFSLHFEQSVFSEFFKKLAIELASDERDYRTTIPDIRQGNGW
jgi:hypothetical protein